MKRKKCAQMRLYEREEDFRWVDGFPQRESPKRVGKRKGDDPTLHAVPAGPPDHLQQL